MSITLEEAARIEKDIPFVVMLQGELVLACGTENFALSYILDGLLYHRNQRHQAKITYTLVQLGKRDIMERKYTIKDIPRLKHIERGSSRKVLFPVDDS